MAQVVQVGLGDLVNQDPLWKGETRNEQKLSRGCSPPASPLTRILGACVHTHTPGHGSWVVAQDPPRPPLLEMPFAQRQGRAESSSLVADGGVQ